MSGTSNNSTSSSKVVLKEVGEVKIAGEVLNSTNHQLKVVDTFEFLWETALKLEPGKDVITTTSGDFVIDYETEHESRWRIELSTNYVGNDGQRYLSVFLVLVKTCKSEDVKTVTFNVIIPTTKDLKGFNYSKTAGITKFSMENTARGFQQFIELNKLGFVTDPKSTEKLQVIVILSDFKDFPHSQPEKISTPPLELELQKDAFVNFEKNQITVDPRRLSHYTSFFDKYVYMEDNPNIKNVPDLSACFANKTLLLKIIEYCHMGRVNMPKSMEGVCNLLKASFQIEILQLRSECQTEILKRLTVSNFKDVVDLARNGFMDEKVAYPAIYTFMIGNINELERNAWYSLHYENFREFYQKLVLYCETEENEENYNTSPLVEEEDWLSFYTHGSLLS